MELRMIWGIKTKGECNNHLWEYSDCHFPVTPYACFEWSPICTIWVCDHVILADGVCARCYLWGAIHVETVVQSGVHILWVTHESAATLQPNFLIDWDWVRAICVGMNYELCLSDWESCRKENKREHNENATKHIEGNQVWTSSPSTERPRTINLQQRMNFDKIAINLTDIE